MTLDENHQTQGQKKMMKAQLVKSCKVLDLNLLNYEEIRSRRDYNCYKIEYPIQFHSLGIKPTLLVETTYITKAYPSEIKNVTSIIYDYLFETKNVAAIEKYDLKPFEIRVQTLDRTLVDKVFAICDYFKSDKIERNSRHIYDLYYLSSKVKLDEKLKELVNEVRSERKENPLCISAQDGVNVSSMLLDIIKTNAYKSDYEKITKTMMHTLLPYEDAINAIKIISESGVFD